MKASQASVCEWKVQWKLAIQPSRAELERVCVCCCFKPCSQGKVASPIATLLPGRGDKPRKHRPSLKKLEIAFFFHTVFFEAGPDRVSMQQSTEHEKERAFSSHTYTHTEAQQLAIDLSGWISNLTPFFGESGPDSSRLLINSWGTIAIVNLASSCNLVCLSVDPFHLAQTRAVTNQIMVIFLFLSNITALCPRVDHGDSGVNRVNGIIRSRRSSCEAGFTGLL